MTGVNVNMGDRAILQNIHWQVNRGEQWALLGPNGAGKTTLLSLITADNPQGYSNNLILFDRRRGSGESVWDIKRRIGFVSPELHLYFLRGDGIFNTIPGISRPAHHSYHSLRCSDVIISGFNDEIGFVSTSTGYQEKKALEWMHTLGLAHLENRRYSDASLGEQRSLLLVRALIKSPDLLILDEPCQGLDPRQTQRFVALLDLIGRHHQTTMIYVTHLRAEIPPCVNRILELENGCVKYSGLLN